LSPFDIAVLYSLLPVCTGVVANNEFRRIPVLSYWMRLTGAIFVEQGNAAAEFSAFRLMVERLKGGKSLLLFPEGYINQGKDLAKFKRGGIHSAILAHVPIVPVSLCGTNKVMRPGGLSIVPGQQVLVQFGEPIEAWKLDAKSRKCIDLRLRDRIAAMQESCGQ
ncbi:MAG: 1-acyl-sn-glycerol-3-phosphate acyltransferase, partial [Spirochaetaceae bacterium]|nr:1-acyl-sn-glycerol-3-phosphate acyltransferase [Spirochaetaceae bacterium]